MLSRTGQNLCTIIFSPFYQTASIKGIVRRVYAVNGTRQARMLKSLAIIYCYAFNFLKYINLLIIHFIEKRLLEQVKIEQRVKNSLSTPILKVLRLKRKLPTQATTNSVWKSTSSYNLFFLYTEIIIYFYARFAAALIRNTYFLPKNMCVWGLFFGQKYDFGFDMKYLF